MFTLKNLLFKRSYRYKPLEPYHIRLLKLFPGVGNAPITCSLQSVNLLEYEDITGKSKNEELQTYDALSYTWGDPKKTTTIICEGRVVHVTLNLRDALLCLRDAKNPRILWADALCIDQRNEIERGIQVKLMGLIYWKARHIHVWLGDNNPEDPVLDVGQAVDLMAKISQLWDESTTVGSPGYSLRLHGPDSELMMHSNEWAAMELLLDRPWFQRVWVVQELGLARDATFYCGDTSFCHRDLNRFVHFMDGQGSPLRRVHNLSFKMIHMAYRYKESTRGNYRLELGSDPMLAETILDVLHGARNLACTDRRDSVYAFLGHPSAFKQQLLDDVPYMWYPRNYYNKKKSLIEPDYSAANTFLDVYVSIAVACIEQLDLGLEVLSHVAHDEESIETYYPSWVPRWDVPSPSSFSRSRETYYAASGAHSLSPMKVLHQHPRSAILRLELKARFLGGIKSVEDLRFKSLHSSIKSLIEEPCDPTGIAVTFTAGLSMGTDLLFHPAEDNLTQHYYNFQAFMRQEESSHPEVSVEASPDGFSAEESEAETANYYGITLRQFASHRTFFQTDNGCMGLGPSISREGDELWLPMGARMPLVLRKVSEESFRVLGQAYLHGVMRGEAVNNLTADDFTLITLC